MKRTAFSAAAATVALSIPLAFLPSAGSAADPGSGAGTISGTISGTVVALVSEHRHGDHDEVRSDAHGGAEHTDLVLATADGYVPVPEGVELTPGTRVTAAIDGGELRVLSSRAAAKAAPVPANIERKVYVGIVAPAGYAVADNPTTMATVQRHLDQASDYWASQTGGTIRFSLGGTIPKYVSAHPCGRTTDMWNEAVKRFADAGIDVKGVGKYLLLVGPPGSSVSDRCDYGLGTLGALDAPWNATFVSDAAQSLYAHELGHNLGLAHANALRCNAVQDGAWDGKTFGTECKGWRYEDLLDVMGYSGAGYGEGNLNSPHLDDLGLDPEAIRSVTGPATVTIPPLSDTAAPGRGVRVTDESGVTYYVEYRTHTGRDVVASVNRFRPSLGVLLYREDPTGYRSHGSYHLDATPSGVDGYDYDRALRPGKTFTSASGTLTISTVSQDASGAVVAINGATEPEAPPVATAPASVTLDGPNRARRNGKVTLAATVRSATDAVVPDVRVTFQRRTNGSWVTVATTRTNANGVARAVVKVRRASTFRAGIGDPATYSSKTAVKARKGPKHR